MLKKKIKSVFTLLSVFIICCCSTPSGGGSNRNSNSYQDGASGIINVSGANPKTINTLYGQNYWCWSNFGNQISGTEDIVSKLNLKVLRSGGYNSDSQMSNGFDPFDYSLIDRYVAYCRSINAEPILQVPLLKNMSGGQATAQDAADMVTYCNITKGYKIKYWEIGNEPDLYSDSGDRAAYTVTDLCNDFKSFSTSMKAVDPTIKIIGPDFSWKYYPGSGEDDWMTPFIQNCKGYFDIVSIHYYPFSADQCTISNAMADAGYFRKLLQALRSLFDANGLSNIPLAITESNITWDGDPSHSIYECSPQTFYAGLWLADNLGSVLENNLWAVCYWSLCEAWTLDFIDENSKQPKPNYYVYQMFTNNFGSSLISATFPQGFSVYASRNASNDQTILIVINKNCTNNQETIKFTGFNKSLKDKSYYFPAYSITCLTIPDNGSSMKVESYTKDIADNGKPPQLSN